MQELHEESRSRSPYVVRFRYDSILLIDQTHSLPEVQSLGIMLVRLLRHQVEDPICHKVLRICFYE